MDRSECHNWANLSRWHSLMLYYDCLLVFSIMANRVVGLVETCMSKTLTLLDSLGGFQ